MSLEMIHANSEIGPTARINGLIVVAEKGIPVNTNGIDTTPCAVAHKLMNPVLIAICMDSGGHGRCAVANIAWGMSLECP